MTPAQIVAAAMLVLFIDMRVGATEALGSTVPGVLVAPAFFNATAGMTSK